MARTKSKKRLVGTWSTQQRREAMEQSREAARGPVDLPFLLLTLLLTQDAGDGGQVAVVDVPEEHVSAGGGCCRQVCSRRDAVP